MGGQGDWLPLALHPIPRFKDLPCGPLRVTPRLTIPATSWTIEEPASLRSDDWPASGQNSGRLQIGMLAAFAGIPSIDPILALRYD
jgi:hypothetical protein